MTGPVFVILGGVFVTDPWLGFPGDVPELTETSWHARVHDIAPALVVDVMIISCLLFTPRFAGLGNAADSLTASRP